MHPANVSRKISLRVLIVLLPFLCLLSACASGPAAPARSSTNSTSKPASPVGTAPTITLPAEGVAATIPVGPQPEIFVESGSAKQLTFVGSAARSISTNLYALPYKKEGNKVYISFGQTIDQALVIQIPRQASLTVTLTEGNVSVETIQGAVNITLTGGTINLKNFTPQGTDTIQTGSGTIGVTFAKNASCSLKAQTNFGAITSGYATISEKRSGQKAEASGTIRGGTGATVSLTVDHGSISLGPA